MKIWKIVLYVAVFVAFASCGTYNTTPKIQITHVLAVTETGDTLRLPINMIKPNVYYNVISYPNYNGYYSNWYNGYSNRIYSRSTPVYVTPSNNSSNNNNNNSNNSSNNNSGANTVPDIPSRPKPAILKKGKQ